MKKYNVAILGATGAVGAEMLKILEERDFPINELHLLASPRSVGKKVSFRGNEYTIELASHKAFKGMDIVLGAASNSVAKEFAPTIKNEGALFIDNSSAFRMDKDVPLIIPEINSSDIKNHHGIIANPNCSTIITLVAVNAINKLSKIKAMNAVTYQATSGAGAEGPIELKSQMESLLNGGSIEPEVFQYQICNNLIPQIGSFLDNGYTTEEMKMQNEGRKILHNDELLVNCTCVRVPVERSHSIAVTLVTEDYLELDQINYAMLTTKGVKLYDMPMEKKYPMPLLTTNQDLVYVGRIRRDILNKNGITLFCSGDQVRKGAATNAVQIALAYIGLEF